MINIHLIYVINVTFSLTESLFKILVSTDKR